MSSWIEILIFAILFAAFAAVNLYRLCKGPTPGDRMCAGDSMDILVTCAMILYSIYTGRAIFLDISIISALLGIIDTMLVGRYLDTGRWRNKK